MFAEKTKISLLIGYAGFSEKLKSGTVARQLSF